MTIGLKEIYVEGVDWIDVTHDKCVDNIYQTDVTQDNVC
jgi:hypothetical protein